MLLMISTFKFYEHFDIDLILKVTGATSGPWQANECNLADTWAKKLKLEILQITIATSNLCILTIGKCIFHTLIPPPGV